jgi:hypothetical protein
MMYSEVQDEINIKYLLGNSSQQVGVVVSWIDDSVRDVVCLRYK